MEVSWRPSRPTKSSSAHNQDVIKEFRANHGVVSQQPPDPAPDHHRGTDRAAGNRPLGFFADDKGRVFVLASKAGSPRHPAWFHNLRANPSVTVELGDRSFQAQAVVTEGEERDRLYGMIADGVSQYHAKTDQVSRSSSSKASRPRMTAASPGTNSAPAEN